MENSGTSARPYSCYSNLLWYNSGKYLPITSPVPITPVPAIYTYARPHIRPQVVETRDCDNLCKGYRKFGNLEKSNTYYGN